MRVVGFEISDGVQTNKIASDAAAQCFSKSSPVFKALANAVKSFEPRSGFSTIILNAPSPITLTF